MSNPKGISTYSEIVKNDKERETNNINRRTYNNNDNVIETYNNNNIENNNYKINKTPEKKNQNTKNNTYPKSVPKREQGRKKITTTKKIPNYRLHCSNFKANQRTKIINRIKKEQQNRIK